jgi:hypothetical protein
MSGHISNIEVGWSASEIFYGAGEFRWNKDNALVVDGLIHKKGVAGNSESQHDHAEF